MAEVIDRVRAWARRLEAEVAALALAARHPDTPWYAKALALLILAYALSPIDLIPDAIPVLGLLDDLILIPLGLALVLRLIPARVLEACRAEALEAARPARGAAGAILVVATWLLSAAALAGLVLWLRR